MSGRRRDKSAVLTSHLVSNNQQWGRHSAALFFGRTSWSSNRSATGCCRHGARIEPICHIGFDAILAVPGSRTAGHYGQTPPHTTPATRTRRVGQRLCVGKRSDRS